MGQMKVTTFVTSSARQVIFAPTINASLDMNPWPSSATEYWTVMMAVMRSRVQSIQFVVLMVFIVVFKLASQAV